MFVSTLMTLGSAAGVVAGLIIVGICIAASGSWWPLTVLLALAIIAWVIPWEILRERRQSKASKL